MKKNIILAIFILLLSSCNEESIKRYVGEDYVYFEKENTDSLTFSFAYDEKLTQGTVKIPVNFITKISNRERAYKIKFAEDVSTALQGRDFIKIQEEQALKAGKSADTLVITVLKSDELKDKIVTAVFEIQQNDEFIPAFDTYSKARIIISDKLERPAWWNDWHVANGLGTYSKKKYKLFIEITGEYNLDYENRDDMDYSKMRYLLLKFKNWLIDNPQLEEDGNPMEVKVKG